MLTQILLAYLLVSVATASDDVALPGKCPELSPLANFDVEKYTSKNPWYQAYIFEDGDYFKKIKCSELRLKYNAETRVMNMDIYFVNGSRSVWMNADEEYMTDKPGTFRYPESVRKASSEWYVQLEHKVLLIDYDHYIVVWGCYDIEGEDKHHEMVIVNSLHRSLSDEHLNEIKAYFAERHPIVNLVPMSWDDCRVKCEA